MWYLLPLMVECGINYKNRQTQSKTTADCQIWKIKQIVDQTDSINSQVSKITTVPKDAKSKAKRVMDLLRKLIKQNNEMHFWVSLQDY